MSNGNINNKFKFRIINLRDTFSLHFQKKETMESISPQNFGFISFLHQFWWGDLLLELFIIMRAPKAEIVKMVFWKDCLLGLVVWISVMLSEVYLGVSSKEKCDQN